MLLFWFLNISYSSCKLFTGLAYAALMDWKLTVNNAIAMVIPAAYRNIVTGSVVLNAKPSSQFMLKYTAIGIAMTLAKMTRSKNSLLSNCMMLNTVAPRTFLIPISLVLTCAV